MRSIVECENPNPDLGRFVGRIKVLDQVRCVAFGPFKLFDDVNNYLESGITTLPLTSDSFYLIKERTGLGLPTWSREYRVEGYPSQEYGLCVRLCHLHGKRFKNVTKFQTQKQ